MEKEAGLGPVKRLGVRYGRTTKYNLAKIEFEQKKPQKCPYCKKAKAKRQFAGVYECAQCGSKFTGKAYFLEQKIRNEQEEENAELIAAPEAEAAPAAEEEEAQ